MIKISYYLLQDTTTLVSMVDWWSSAM